jgi:hypothetical protein
VSEEDLYALLILYIQPTFYYTFLRLHDLPLLPLRRLSRLEYAQWRADTSPERVCTISCGVVELTACSALTRVAGTGERDESGRLSSNRSLAHPRLTREA